MTQIFIDIWFEEVPAPTLENPARLVYVLKSLDKRGKTYRFGLAYETPEEASAKAEEIYNSHYPGDNKE